MPENVAETQRRTQQNILSGDSNLCHYPNEMSSLAQPDQDFIPTGSFQAQKFTKWLRTQKAER